MWRRRRGASTGLAVAVFLAVLAIALVPLVAGRDRAGAAWRLVVLDPEGGTLARVDLDDGRFGLRYRNSVYRSNAEERFAIGDDGRIHLVGLAADEVAVLGEYYAARVPRRTATGDVFRWEASPTQRVVLERLTVAATDLGARTLIVEGRTPIALWQLVADSSPGVSLGAERIP